ncbi:MAG: histone deacetylase family protein [Halobaculum sp.]
MRFGHSETCLAHDTGPRHPERPERIRAVREGLKRKHGVSYVESDPASVELLESVHDPDYVADVESFCADGGGDWDPDTVACPETYAAAAQSAGLAAWAGRVALDDSGGRETPFSLGRPPGHHAVADDAMGFCFFNNAVVAARAAMDAGAERVAIFDWDVHHGNGTQDLTYESADVFYASIHEDGLYPGTGAVSETGAGAGAGTTLNVPVGPGAGDADYRHAVREAVVPAFERFDPDLVVVSAGFDAHRQDPISRTGVTTDGYALMTAAVRELAERVGAGIAFVLEGGYQLDALADGVGIVHETFDGRPPIEPDDEPGDDTRETVRAVREALGLAE